MNRERVDGRFKVGVDLGGGGSLQCPFFSLSPRNPKRVVNSISNPYLLRLKISILLLTSDFHLPVDRVAVVRLQSEVEGGGIVRICSKPPTSFTKMPSQKIETGHQDVVHDVAMDYYGKRLATASSDATVKIFGVSDSSQQLLANLSGHNGPVWQVAWAHPKFGSLLASCGYDGRVVLWKEGSSPNEWIQQHVFTEHKSSVNSIAWAPYELGLWLACGSSDGSISVFSARADGGWDISRVDQAHPVGVTSVSWAPSTAPGALVSSGQSDLVQKLCSGGADNTVKVWKLYNGTWKLDCFPALQMHTDWVRDVAWAPNLGLPKSTIASASQDGKVIIWTVVKEGEQWDGKVLNDFKTPVWRVTWSLTGNILAVADGNNNVTLWKEAVDGMWQQVTTVEP